MRVKNEISHRWNTNDDVQVCAPRGPYHICRNRISYSILLSHLRSIYLRMDTGLYDELKLKKMNHNNKKKICINCGNTNFHIYDHCQDLLIVECTKCNQNIRATFDYDDYDKFIK